MAFHAYVFQGVFALIRHPRRTHTLVEHVRDSFGLRHHQVGRSRWGIVMVADQHMVRASAAVVLAQLAEDRAVCHVSNSL